MLLLDQELRQLLARPPPKFPLFVSPTPQTDLSLELFGGKLSISPQRLQEPLSSLDAQQRRLLGRKLRLLQTERSICPIAMQPGLQRSELVDLAFVVAKLCRKHRQLAGQRLHPLPRPLQLHPQGCPVFLIAKTSSYRSRKIWSSFRPTSPVSTLPTSAYSNTELQAH